MKLSLKLWLATFVATTITTAALGQGYGDDEQQQDIRHHVIQITSPGLGANLSRGTMETITWTAPADMRFVSIYLLDSEDRDRIKGVIAENIPNTGSYSWAIDSRFPVDQDLIIAIIGKGRENADYRRVHWYLGTGKGTTFVITKPTPADINTNGITLLSTDGIFNYYKVVVHASPGMTGSLQYRTILNSYKNIPCTTKMADASGTMVWTVQFMKADAEASTFCIIPNVYRNDDD
jgi:hypothetical protein